MNQKISIVAAGPCSSRAGRERADPVELLLLGQHRRRKEMLRHQQRRAAKARRKLGGMACSVLLARATTHDEGSPMSSLALQRRIDSKAAFDEPKTAFDAVEVAEQLAGELAATAIARDRAGGTAKVERDRLRASGLLALSIPSQFGGLGATWADTLRIVRRLARVDGSLAHLFGFHHLLVATVRLFGDELQWAHAYSQTARHAWFWGNALNPLDQRTSI